MKSEQRLRLRKALHEDYERGVQYEDALANIYRQHGMKAAAQTTVSKWWKQFANREAPLTLPRNARTAVGQFNNSSIELRTATQRSEFAILTRNANFFRLNVSSRALDGRFLYFHNRGYGVGNIVMVDLLYNQTRFAFQNQSCLHFAAKTF